MAPRSLTAWRRRRKRKHRLIETTQIPRLLDVPIPDRTDAHRSHSLIQLPESGAETVGPNWTGEIRLHLHNARNWAAGTVVLVLGRDTVRVWLDDREVAVLVRDRLRAWFHQEYPDPYGGYGLFWSFEDGQVCLRPGTQFFTVCPECLCAFDTVL